MEIKLKRIGDAYHMEGSGQSPVKVNIDASEDIGGENLGARPMELLLMGLGGCTSIDVILVLKKQKQDLKEYEVTVSGERETIEGTMMNVFRKIHIHYKLFGDIDEKRVERAIKLSMEKYCSATGQLRDSAEITHTYEIIRE